MSLCLQILIFLQILRGSTKDDLNKIYGQVKGKNLER